MVKEMILLNINLLISDDRSYSRPRYSCPLVVLPTTTSKVMFVILLTTNDVPCVVLVIILRPYNKGRSLCHVT